MFELAFLNDRQHRQVTLRPGCYWLGSDISATSDCEPVIVDDPWISADQAKLILNEDGSLDLQNFGRPILLPTGRRIKTQMETRLDLPTEFSIGKTRFALHSSVTPLQHDETLTTITRRLADHNAFTPQMDDRELNSRFLQSPPAADTLVHWFDALNELQRSTVGSEDFYQKAVQSVLDPGGLDLGLILTKNRDRWDIAASHVPFPEAGISFRQDIVQQVIKEKRLWFHLGSEQSDLEQDRATLPHWVVAAPVFGANDEVVAVLYGARLENAYNNRHGIRPLEAHFVRMVADSVSSAMTRLRAEAEAARSQVLLEQTFSPKVVHILKRDPKLLQSRESEVTVLFADLRNFSGLAETLSPSTTHQLLGDLFNHLTSAVEQTQGVVIDYYGDGLAAFWNAPVETPDHPFLASRCALQLQQELVSVNQQWSETIGQPLQIGIGIHTGIAQVGNSGCHRKLKYGPRGTTVNAASRLESATKYYRVPILISDEVARRINDRMLTLRLCRTRVPGLRQPMVLHQLVGQELSIEKLKFGETYEAALAAMEKQDWETCVQQLLILHDNHANDPRVDFLLQELESHSLQEPKLNLPDSLVCRQKLDRNPEKVDVSRAHYRVLYADKEG